MPHGPFSWGWFEDDPLGAAQRITQGTDEQDEELSDDGDDDLEASWANEPTVPTHED